MAHRNGIGGARKQTAAQPAVKRVKPKASAYQMPERLPEGQILIDVNKKEWRLGYSIGVGGFGEIYSASSDLKKPVPSTASYVIKIEPHENGPLFSEKHFYSRAAKDDMGSYNLIAEKGLKFLGMPKMYGFGSHQYSGTEYRFMVMARYGTDLQKIFESNKKKLSVKSAFSIAIKLLDVLEYIHSTGYVHADIKAANLLLGYINDNEIYLVDFGLACKYMYDDVHKEYKVDPRRAHDGTVEFTSRDAHLGASLSRRGDLEILAYNLVQWLCSQLPWEPKRDDPEYVFQEKEKFVKNIGKSLSSCFKNTTPPEPLETYFKYATGLEFDQEPDYDYCRQLFRNGLKKAGFKDDGRLELKYPASTVTRRMTTRTATAVDNSTVDETSPPQVKRAKNGTANKLQANHEPDTKIKVSRSGTTLLKSKTLSKSTPSFGKYQLDPAIVPTPAMLEIMRKKDKSIAQLQMPVEEKTNRKKSRATATKRPESENVSSEEEFFTPPSRYLRSGRKRRSSSDLNGSVTPELF